MKTTLLKASRALLLMACATLLFPFEAQAQRRGGTVGDFDFYVLSLSWSPTFCQSKGDERGSRQCDIGAKRDFVVHGLWPQFTRGYPSDCGPRRSPTRQAMDKAERVYPDAGLARYEWNKHGTCATDSASEYFDLVAKARDSVDIPALLKQPKGVVETSPMEIERAFTAANRGLRADMMAVTCRKGMLEEVRICFTKDLRSFTTCPEVNRGACRSRDITAPAGR